MIVEARPDEEPHALLHHCFRHLPGLISLSSLSLPDNLPSHAVRSAVASTKAGNEKFLMIGPIDRRGVTQSVLRAPGWPYTEVELTVATGELVDSEPLAPMTCSSDRHTTL